MARILIVDDDMIIRELLLTVLGDGGHAAEAVEDGRAAMARLRQERFDLVFLDRTMPGLSGMEALVMIRKDPALKGLKVVMCTGSGMVADADDALTAGADDYVVKPLEIARLLDKVARHTAKPATPAAAPAPTAPIVRPAGAAPVPAPVAPAVKPVGMSPAPPPAASVPAARPIATPGLLPADEPFAPPAKEQGGFMGFLRNLFRRS